MQKERWIIIPTVKANGIVFGMSKHELRSLLGLPIREFKKSKYSKAFTDDYGSFHIFYNSDEKCEAVEVFDAAEINVNGYVLYPLTIDEMLALPLGFSKEDSGLVSIENSIGVYVQNGKVESITIAGKDYY